MGGIFGSKTQQVQTGSTQNNPWAPIQGNLLQAKDFAANLFNQGGKQIYQGPTLASTAPETLQAQKLITQRALQGSEIQRAGQNTMLESLRGNFLQANPYLNSAMAQANQESIQQFRQAQSPNLQGQAAKYGRYGSGAFQSLYNQAQGSLAKALAQQNNQIMYQNYGQERQNQMQAAQMAPQYAQADYQDYQNLSQVGAQKQAASQAQLNDSKQRFDDQQNQPYQRLKDYIDFLNSIGGSYGSSAQYGQQDKNSWKRNALGGFAQGIFSGGGLFGGMAGGILGGLK